MKKTNQDQSELHVCSSSEISIDRGQDKKGFRFYVNSKPLNKEELATSYNLGVDYLIGKFSDASMCYLRKEKKLLWIGLETRFEKIEPVKGGLKIVCFNEKAYFYHFKEKKIIEAE